MSFTASSLQRSIVAATFACAATLSFNAMAEPLSVKATMVPKEQIKLDFKDGSGHFVLMVRREGTASGSGLLADGPCSVN